MKLKTETTTTTTIQHVGGLVNLKTETKTTTTTTYTLSNHHPDSPLDVVWVQVVDGAPVGNVVFDFDGKEYDFPGDAFVDLVGGLGVLCQTLWPAPRTSQVGGPRLGSNGRGCCRVGGELTAEVFQGDGTVSLFVHDEWGTRLETTHMTTDQARELAMLLNHFADKETS